MMSKGNIIIADDEKAIRNLVGTIIKSKFPGFEREFYNNGIELEERLKQFPENVRLVFTDNSMESGKKGSDLIAEYSKNGWEKVPFILHYGGDYEIGEKAVHEGGAFNYLLKPANMRNIRSAITSALSFYERINNIKL